MSSKTTYSKLTAKIILTTLVIAVSIAYFMETILKKTVLMNSPYKTPEKHHYWYLNHSTHLWQMVGVEKN